MSASQEDLIEILTVKARQLPPAGRTPESVEGMAIWSIVKDERAGALRQKVRMIADDARREVDGILKARYGARNPKWGWVGGILLLAGLAAGFAFAAALMPVRSPWMDDSEAATWSTVHQVCAIVCAMLLVAAIAVVRLRPVNRSFIRMQLLAPGFLAVSLFNVISSGQVLSIWLVIALALSVLSPLYMIVIRAMNRAELNDIDFAVPYAETAVREKILPQAERIQQEITDGLSPEQRAMIVEVRDALIERLFPVTVARGYANAAFPAGGVIIHDVLKDWYHPLDGSTVTEGPSAGGEDRG